MPVTSNGVKTKKVPVKPTTSVKQLEHVKPIEVKCFLDDQTIQIETEKNSSDVTATMTTVVPAPVKRPVSAPVKPRIPWATPITNMVVSKPIRHLAILPSSKDPSRKTPSVVPTSLSETFTLYEPPNPTPVLGRSLDHQTETNDVDIREDHPPEISLDQCDTTCELVEHTKSFPKPHSLIGRYAAAPPVQPENPVLHIATVQYSDPPIPDPNTKQMLIQQFYAQLEQMKAVFSTDLNPKKLTTNTLTFDNGQVQQTIDSHALKEKPPVARPPPVSDGSVKKKALVARQQQREVRKSSCPRIQSAPITMATKTSASTFNARTVEQRPRQKRKSVSQTKKKTRSESAPPPQPPSTDLRPAEVVLLPEDEEDCRKIFEKLQRLQPEGVCVDMNTLRRALYPPVGTTTYSSSSSTGSFQPPQSRLNEMPKSWLKDGERYISPYVPQSFSSTDPKFVIASDQNNIDRIAEQMRKHAAINYTYYTRTTRK